MKNLLLIIALVPCFLFGQASLKNIRHDSYRVLAYRVTAAAAEKYIREDSIPVDQFASQQPVRSFLLYADTDSLPKGNYVIIRTLGEDLAAELLGVTNLLVVPVNNRYKIQLDIRNLEGHFITDAGVWVNNRAAKYDATAMTYRLKQKKLESGIIKIYAPGDSTFVELDGNDDYIDPVWKQRWNNFKITRFGKIINYIPSRLSSRNNGRKYKPNNIGATGYMLFNQPKYKLTDTVKLKAYIVDRKWKQYTQKANVYLEYYYKGKANKQLLTTLYPVSAGSYVYSFPLSDTLASDIKYNIVFKTAANKIILSKQFSTEDYLLDEIANYNLRTSREIYYPGDSIHVYASAKDANGLPLLDARATLIITTGAITKFYKDTMWVPDTLYVESKPLVAEGETIFSMSTNMLPNAQLDMNTTVVFKNSNNESHEESEQINYDPIATELKVTTEKDSVYASYLVNGKQVPGKGEVYLSGDNIDRTMEITFPATLKIDPLADNYEFTLINNKDTINKSIDIEDYRSLSFSRISSGDTVGFNLNNPYKIPVNYIILDGKRLFYSGKSDEENIKWVTWAVQKKKMLTLKWQYTWAGEQREGTEKIALLYNLLQINVNNEKTIFPGQKDTVTVEVKDYKNHAAAGVNLAAVAYNSQFKKDIVVREPPYLAKYKSKGIITGDTYETDDAYPLKRYKLGEHKQWLNLLSVDTMPFYKMLFPKSFPYDVVTPISEFIPQLSIHVVKKGQLQEIYLLYLNRNLVYYSGVTDKTKYAFETLQGYSQVGIRLQNKFIEVDSLYIQPFYKHDIFIDIDSLPPHSKIEEAPLYWTWQEKSLIEKSSWQFSNTSSISEAWLWRYNQLVKLDNASRHIVGPFTPADSLHYFAPGNFDIHFRFEPGYEYNLSKQILRLEKKSIFPNDTAKVYLPKIKEPLLMIGDTIIPHPEISYPEPVAEPKFKLSNYWNNNQYNTGKLYFTVAKDTVIKWVVLRSTDSANISITLKAPSENIYSIPAGNYELLLVNKELKIAKIPGFKIITDNTFCINTSSFAFTENKELILSLLAPDDTVAKNIVSPTAIIDPGKNKLASLPEYPFGPQRIVGKVIDATGRQGIPGAIVLVKGTRNAVSTSSDGSFVFNNIAGGFYTLTISSIGYETKEIPLKANDNNDIEIIALKMMSQNLEEVVVTGYGTQKRMSLAGSVSSIKTQELSGKMAGLSVNNDNNSTTNITLRGISSFAGDSKPIYVIDGLIYDELPANIKPEMIANAEILKDAAATAIYGARGANGVVVITTGSNATRKNFKDNAIWQPELVTDSEGKVSFEVVYPDNITGWEIFVLGMDKKHRMGKGQSFTKAYKPVMAQLNTPLFLIENDSSEFIGKISNYTADDYALNSQLVINKNIVRSSGITVKAKESSVSSIIVTSPNTDTMQASFSIKTTAGFADGEERKIPVFKTGTEETTGQFYLLQTDTSVNYKILENGGPVELYAQNNTLDLMLNELVYLKKYPYYCMEQTASKLKGLLMEKEIFLRLNKPFKEDKTINFLLKKLLDNQQFDGGWSWWEKGHTNLKITCYVVDALRMTVKDPLTETGIRNGLLYLQNQLAVAGREDLLQVLSTMSAAAHVINYGDYISKIPFDSLTVHQQWQWVKICQEQHLEYSKQLETLIALKKERLPEGTYWGSENYRWYNNDAATTVLAFKFLQKEKKYEYLLPGIVQYFLQKKQNGHWQNTVESASITSTITPYLLQTQPSFNSPASLIISGDTTFSTLSFPFASKIANTSHNDINIKKTGGGIVYLTLYQKHWEKQSSAVSDNFEITTYFEKNGQRMIDIPAGEKVKMIVKLTAKKDADFVMLQVPIPAGCNYGNKKQDYSMHWEYFKNKAEIFTEFLSAGVHEFEIELEPRYKGHYTLNPAKVELMYFPTFFGRNEMKKVNIK